MVIVIKKIIERIIHAGIVKAYRLKRFDVYTLSDP